MLSVQGNILGIILFFFSFEGNSFANFPNKTNDKNRKINIFFHCDENDKFNLYHKGNEYILYILCLEMDKSMWTDVFFLQWPINGAVKL